MVQTAEAALHLEAVEVDVALRAEAPGTLVALTEFLRKRAPSQPRRLQTNNPNLITRLWTR